MIQAVRRAVEQIRGAAATVHLKGQTEHHCQVQLVPLFIKEARAAGLSVQEAALGRLLVGQSEVFFEPLYLAQPALPAESTRKKKAP
jgi:hypothetical protein